MAAERLYGTTTITDLWGLLGAGDPTDEVDEARASRKAPGPLHPSGGRSEVASAWLGALIVDAKTRV